MDEIGCRAAQTSKPRIRQEEEGKFRYSLCQHMMFLD